VDGRVDPTTTTTSIWKHALSRIRLGRHLLQRVRLCRLVVSHSAHLRIHWIQFAESGSRSEDLVQEFEGSVASFGNDLSTDLDISLHGNGIRCVFGLGFRWRLQRNDPHSTDQLGHAACRQSHVGTSHVQVSSIGISFGESFGSCFPRFPLRLGIRLHQQSRIQYYVWLSPLVHAVHVSQLQRVEAKSGSAIIRIDAEEWLKNPVGGGASRRFSDGASPTGVNENKYSVIVVETRMLKADEEIVERKKKLTRLKEKMYKLEERQSKEMIKNPADGQFLNRRGTFRAISISRVQKCPIWLLILLNWKTLTARYGTFSLTKTY